MIEITKCPMCQHKLYKKYEGLVCKNWKCKLYFKCGKGWCLIRKKETEEEIIINSMWNRNANLFNRKRWAKLKSIILKRDNYKCSFCDYNLVNDYYRKNDLQVHHIVPSHKQSALYFDEENLITVCNICHKKLHKADKHKFGGNDD